MSMSEDDQDLAISHEHSEWDSLRERFENAAREGNVIDLTNDSDEGVALEEASMPRSDPLTSPSAIVQVEDIQWTSDENRVRVAMGEVMAKVLSLRELLVRSFEDSRFIINVNSVDDVNAKVHDLNRTIRSIDGGFRGVLRTSIENLGRLVHKVNLLITDYNRSRDTVVLNDSDEEDQVERIVNSTVSRSLRPRQEGNEATRRIRRRESLGLRTLKRRRKDT